MQTFLRFINIVFGPVLTLLFAAQLSELKIAGKDAGDAIGGAAAALVMLAVELGLTRGPRHSAWLRRWLDPRASFEGIWVQDVINAVGNRAGVFRMDYDQDTDTFSVHGHAYTAEGEPWAKWDSTHMFMDPAQLEATYLWKGEVLRQPTRDADKTGTTELRLRKPPVFSLPLTGDGSVWHVGEETRLKFRMRRVTRGMLKELGLMFSVRELLLDAHDEELQLVAAFLKRQRANSATAVPEPQRHAA
ncbi:MAG TPA: hypothetical protein VJ743_02155 [Albitalea sp.]|nr:hypothetical protein [Albitalea sp.]